MDSKILDNLEQDYSFQLSLLCLMTVPHQAQADGAGDVMARRDQGNQIRNAAGAE